MARRDLEITMNRRGKPVESLDMNADPDNIPGLQAVLRGWLEGEGWDPKLWGQFAADIRYAGQGKIRRTVRL